MHEYRVTKYDPKYRVEGQYRRDEWTSFSDVGKVYGGRPFTLSDYECVEQRYIDFLCELVQREGVKRLAVFDYEDRGNELPWQSTDAIEAEELPLLVRDVLRERCWCRLIAPGFFIHFGYDYYMYVGGSFTTEGMTALARAYHLFAENMISPYYRVEDEATVPNDLRPMTAVYLTRGDKILLLYRVGSRVVGNSYTGTAGGHMEEEEIASARTCVLRELHEETGLTAAALEGLAMRYITMRLKDGEVRQNYYFFAELREGFEPAGSNEGRLNWFALNELEALPMPVTAKNVLQHYVREGRHTQLLYGGVTTERGTIFTSMTEF